MRVVDLTLRWTDDSPSYLGHPNPKSYYIKRRPDQGKNAQMLELPVHNGTHIDGERHMNAGGRPIGEIPISKLITDGVVIDLSDVLDDYGIYSVDDILDQPVEVKKGDAIIIHTGHSQYAYNKPQSDLPRYFLKHPGPDGEFAEWVSDMKVPWLGTDTPSMDHPMNGTVRGRYPKNKQEFETVHGGKAEKIFPEESFNAMHNLLLDGILHIENVGGEITEVLNERVTLGCFPWRMIDVESSPCRLVAFTDI